MTADAEKALIGCLLMDGQVVKRCGNLKPEHFKDQLLGRIYREYLHAADIGQSLTVPYLRQRLGDIPLDGFTALLQECSAATVTSTEAGMDAQAIMNDYTARTANALLQKPIAAAAVNREIGQLIEQLEALRDNRTTAHRLAEIVEAEKGKHFTDKRKARTNTGFKQLDETLGGFEGGDVIVIGARPAVGKSAFVTQMMTNLAEGGRRVLFFNLEMTDGQVYERLLARTSGIDMQRIRRAVAFQNGEREAVEHANEKLRRLDIWISSGSKTVSEIRQQARNAEADAIIIDYLQLIRADRAYTNRAAEVGAISKAVKSVAMELDVPVILISQLNRQSEGRADREPTMAELRESGDIEQDASLVMLLWNCDAEDNRQKGLAVVKNRHGELVKTRLEFDGAAMTFTEIYNAGFAAVPEWNRQNPFERRRGRNAG